MSLSKEKVISRWKQDKKNYEMLTEKINEILESNIFNKGLNARILCRTKDDTSLMKKLYKKGFDYYPSMTDKSAARVICKFKQDLQIVQEIIQESFEVINKDNKIHHLDYTEQGYKSIHFDVALKADSVEPNVYKLLKNHVAEIQIRTNCEDTWAEIYHDIGYKENSDMNSEIKREFYCLAGLLEVADNCFSTLNEKIMELEILNEEFILNYLKKPFIQKINEHYDYDFSYQNIEVLLPVLESANIHSTDDFTAQMTDFLSTKMDKIDYILTERKNESAEIPYLSQPEIFLIFFLIENEMHALNEKWEETLYLEDLSEMCTYWGVSLDDYDIE